MDNKFNRFFEELKELQDKYEIYLQPDYKEDWEEDWEGDMQYIGVIPYLTAYDESTDELIVVPEYYIEE